MTFFVAQFALKLTKENGGRKSGGDDVIITKYLSLGEADKITPVHNEYSVVYVNEIHEIFTDLPFGKVIARANVV